MTKPCLTMFSDASIFPDRRRSGWGFWIKGDGRDSLSAGGPLKVFHDSSTVAELEAMANGLARARVTGYFRPDDRIIMLQTDSTEALSCLLHVRPTIEISQHEASAPVNRRKKPLDARREAAVKAVLREIDGQGLTPIIRHVRGHKAGNGRNWVNRLCDRLAKDGANQEVRP